MGCFPIILAIGAGLLIAGPFGAILALLACVVFSLRGRA